MGHKDFKMTLRYAHLSPEHKKKAVDLLVKKSIILLDKNLDKECKKPHVDVAQSSNILVTLPETEKPETALNLEPSKV